MTVLSIISNYKISYDIIYYVRTWTYVPFLIVFIYAHNYIEKYTCNYLYTSIHNICVVYFLCPIIWMNNSVNPRSLNTCNNTLYMVTQKYYCYLSVQVLEKLYHFLTDRVAKQFQKDIRTTYKLLNNINY